MIDGADIDIINEFTEKSIQLLSGKVPYGRTEQDDTHNTNEGFGKRTDPYSK